MNRAACSKLPLQAVNWDSRVDIADQVERWCYRAVMWTVGAALLYLLSMGPYFKISGNVMIPRFYSLADRLWLIRSPYNPYAHYMSLWGFTRA